jgi:hypothetical protein
VYIFGYINTRKKMLKNKFFFKNHILFKFFYAKSHFKLNTIINLGVYKIGLMEKLKSDGKMKVQ